VKVTFTGTVATNFCWEVTEMVTVEKRVQVAVSGIQRRKFSKAEYYRMAEMGFFNGQRVELIDGEVILMSPQEAGHATAVELVVRVLEKAFGEGYHVRDQKPLDLGEGQEPEPDAAVVAGSPRNYSQAHPKTAVLVVEVAMSSVDYDRAVKGSLYAKSGIPEYWLLNLRERRLEVFREPVPMPEQIFGFGYKSMRIYLPEETVSPLSKPDAQIKVADLLP
jgi:Uma2 family endonuclease